VRAHQCQIVRNIARRASTQRAVLVLFAVAALATPVAAQSTQGGFAGVIVSAATIENGTSAAVSGSVGYRFTPSVGFSIELTSVPTFDPDVSSPPSIPIIQTITPTTFIFPPPTLTYEGDGGHAIAFTANLRIDAPNRRTFAPFVVAGAGIGSVTDRVKITTTYSPGIILAGVTPISIPTALVRPPVVQTITRTSTDFAVTFGGGVSVFSTKHLALEIDVRYLGVLGSRDLHIGRYGAGISYRF
jgi:opacity protein-like surface antigen